jgi:hypothetical protein
VVVDAGVAEVGEGQALEAASRVIGLHSPRRHVVQQ